MVEQVPTLSVLTMFIIGLAGSGHCVGMCGGITAALGLATEGRGSARLVIGYNLGRIASYALAGAMVAALGYWGRNYLSLGPVLRILAGVILILMGLYLADWWKVLTRLEKLGVPLWRKLQPIGNRFMPVRSMAQAVGVGMVWGWLPCGLVYSALAYAAASARAVDGALLMAAFGLGTAPAMVAGGLFSGALKRFLQARPVRTLMACLMIGFGAWTIYSAGSHLQHSPIGGNASEGGAAHEHEHH